MTEPITVTHEQSVEALITMIKARDAQINALEKELAKIEWATKRRWRVHFFRDGEWWNDVLAGDHMSLATAKLTKRVRLRQLGVTDARIIEVVTIEREVDG